MPMRDDRRAGEEAQQVDEVAGLADDAAAADGLRSCVQCSAGIAPALTVITNAFGPRSAAQQLLDPHAPAARSGG